MNVLVDKEPSEHNQVLMSRPIDPVYTEAKRITSHFNTSYSYIW